MVLGKYKIKERLICESFLCHLFRILSFTSEESEDLVKDQRGYSLIEVLISLALLGIIGVGFLGALGTGLKILSQTDQMETAKNLVESQMEYVRNLDYRSDGLYLAAPIPAEYPGYSAVINAASVTSRDTNLQKITVTISQYGEEVLTLEGYKVNR